MGARMIHDARLSLITRTGGLQPSKPPCCVLSRARITVSPITVEVTKAKPAQDVEPVTFFHNNGHNTMSIYGEAGRQCTSWAR